MPCTKTGNVTVEGASTGILRTGWITEIVAPSSLAKAVLMSSAIQESYIVSLLHSRKWIFTQKFTCQLHCCLDILSGTYPYVSDISHK